MSLPRILVTGGTGFLGSEIVKALVASKKYEVTAIDINPPALGTSSFTSVRYVRANVLQPEELTKVFQEAKPHIVIHTVGVSPAGQKRYSKRGREGLYEINVGGTRNVMEAAKECGARGVVYTSSITVLTDEMDCDFRNADETWGTRRVGLLYGETKTIAETLALSYSTPHFPVCALRPAPIFGPHDPITIPTIHSLINAGTTPFALGPNTNLVDYVYVTNVADAHVLAATNLLYDGSAAGEAFFITNGEPVTFRDLCVGIWKEFGHVPFITVTVPRRVAAWVGWGAEVVAWMGGGEGVLSRGAVWDACAVRYVSIEKARRVLGYEPKVGLADGVRLACQYYREQIEGRKYDKEAWETLR